MNDDQTTLYKYDDIQPPFQGSTSVDSSFPSLSDGVMPPHGLNDTYRILPQKEIAEESTSGETSSLTASYSTPKIVKVKKYRLYKKEGR